MNWNQIEGNWKMYKGKAKERWGELTDDDLDIVSGKRDQLVGLVQKTYGIMTEEADRQVTDFMNGLSKSSKGQTAPTKKAS